MLQRLRVRRRLFTVLLLLLVLLVVPPPRRARLGSASEARHLEPSLPPPLGHLVREERPYLDALDLLSRLLLGQSRHLRHVQERAVPLLVMLRKHPLPEEEAAARGHAVVVHAPPLPLPDEVLGDQRRGAQRAEHQARVRHAARRVSLLLREPPPRCVSPLAHEHPRSNRVDDAGRLVVRPPHARRPLPVQPSEPRWVHPQRLKLLQQPLHEHRDHAVKQPLQRVAPLPLPYLRGRPVRVQPRLACLALSLGGLGEVLVARAHERVPLELHRRRHPPHLGELRQRSAALALGVRAVAPLLGRVGCRRVALRRSRGLALHRRRLVGEEERGERLVERGCKRLLEREPAVAARYPPLPLDRLAADRGLVLLGLALSSERALERQRRVARRLGVHREREEREEVLEARVRRDGAEVEQDRLRLVLPEPEEAAVEVVAVHLAALAHVARLEDQAEGGRGILVPRGFEQAQELVAFNVGYHGKEEVEGRRIRRLKRRPLVLPQNHADGKRQLRYGRVVVGVGGRDGERSERVGHGSDGLLCDSVGRKSWRWRVLALRVGRGWR
mmetsp:Transcript_732/g.1938  ORF Transcript_732/g.1938 Transcript_732/m.1938 type:complete len:558 (+) Transcript_732:857-2530(+)